MENSDKKLGYIIIISFLVVVGIVYCYLVYNYQYKRYDQTVVFNNLGNLAIDDAVKIKGKKIGHVKSISLINNKPNVVLRMYVKIDLRKDYKIFERDKGLMGDREIEINMGISKERIPKEKIIYGQFVSGISEGIAMSDNLKTIADKLVSDIDVFTNGNIKTISFPDKFNKIYQKIDVKSKNLNVAIVGIEEPVNNLSIKLSKISKDIKLLSKNISKKSTITLNNIDSLTDNASKILPIVNNLLIGIDRYKNSLNSDTLFVSKLLKETSIIDTISQNLQMLSEELKYMKQDGRLNVNLF